MVGVSRVDSAVDGIGQSNAVYNRRGVNLQGPRDLEIQIAARKALEISPWFQVEASTHGLQPVFLESTPRPSASMFGLGIATSKGLIQDIPFETLAMVAGQIVFARELGLREVYALLATELAFNSGSVESTHENFDAQAQLEKQLTTVMQNVATCLSTDGNDVRLRWLIDRETLLKDPAVRSRKDEILGNMYPVDGESEVFRTYLAYQNAYVEAMHLGRFAVPGGDTLATGIKGGWHIGGLNSVGTEVVFDTRCVEGLEQMGFFYGSAAMRVAPNEEKKYRPPYGHYWHDTYVIPLLRGQESILAKLLAGPSKPPKEFSSGRRNGQWLTDYKAWVESLVVAVDLIAEAFPAIRLDFAELSERSGTVTRKQLLEHGPTSCEWVDLAAAAQSGDRLKQSELRAKEIAHLKLECDHVRSHLPPILERFGAVASAAE